MLEQSSVLCELKMGSAWSELRKVKREQGCGAAIASMWKGLHTSGALVECPLSSPQGRARKTLGSNHDTLLNADRSATCGLTLFGLHFLVVGAAAFSSTLLVSYAICVFSLYEHSDMSITSDRVRVENGADDVVTGLFRGLDAERSVPADQSYGVAFSFIHPPQWSK